MIYSRSLRSATDELKTCLVVYLPVPFTEEFLYPLTYVKMLETVCIPL